MPHGPFRHRRRQGLPNELSRLFGLDSSTDPANAQPTPTSIVDSPVAVSVSATSANTPVSPTSQAQPSPSSLSSTLTPSSTPPTTSTTPTTTPTTPSSSSVISTPQTTAQPSPSSASTLTFVHTVSSQPAVNGTSSARPSSTNSAVGGASTGIIAGGVLAAIVGTAGIVFALIYFLRKSHRNQDEALPEEIWSRPEARRQSVLLPDEPGPIGPYNAMGTPRPPTMIERHLNNMPSPLSRQPTMPNMFSSNGYGNGYGASESGQSSFYPGDIMTPTSSNPFISPYAQDVLASPVSSSIPDYHVASHPTSPVAPLQALTRSPSSTNQATVIRQNSIPGGPHSPMVSSPNDTDPQYVELSRSSVTPSQGMQYTEITEKLHAPMSSVMATVSEESHDDATFNRMLTPNTAPSPRDEDTPKESANADSGTEYQVVDAPRELDIEVSLPTPIMFEETRISSNPPTLPEIRVPERSFSPVASLELPVPVSARASPSPFSVEFSDVRTPPPAGLKFTSSPLATSTPTSTEPTVIPKAEAKSSKRPDTVYTLYDEEDAYGGF